MSEHIESVASLVERVWTCAEKAVRDGHVIVRDAPPDCFTGEWTDSHDQRNSTVAVAYQRFRRGRPSVSSGPIAFVPNEEALEGLDELSGSLIDAINKEAYPRGNWDRRTINSYGSEELEQDAVLRLYRTRGLLSLAANAEKVIKGYLAEIKRNLLLLHVRSHRIELASSQEDNSDGNGPSLSRLPWKGSSFDWMPTDDVRRVGEQVRDAAQLKVLTAERAGLWLLEPCTLVSGSRYSLDCSRAVADEFHPFWVNVVPKARPRKYPALPSLTTRRAVTASFQDLDQVDEDIDVARALGMNDAAFHQACSRMRLRLKGLSGDPELSPSRRLAQRYLTLRCFSLAEKR